MLQYLSIRKYKHANRLINLWNNELKSTCPISRSFFKSKVLEDFNLNKDASFVAIYDNEPVGFIFIKTWLTDSGFCNEDDRAYISLIFVKKEMRNQGIGSDMLSLAIKEIKKHPNIKIIEVGNEVDKVLSGVPSDLSPATIFFMNKGFAQSEGVVDMIRIVKKDVEDDYDYKDLKIRVATEDDKDELLKICVKNGWKRSAFQLNEYFENGGSGRRIVVGAREDNSIVGIARIYEQTKFPIRINALFNGSHVGGIIFLGINEEDQGKGYDIILNKACKNYLIQRGCKKIMVPATKKIQYYKKLGYSAFKYYLRFEMKI